MKMANNERFDQPAAPNNWLLWLTDPGADVPTDIASVLRAELLASNGAVVAGLISVLILNAAAVLMHAGPVFTWLLAANALISALRALVVRRVVARIREQPGAPIEFYLVTGILWAGISGAIAYFALRSDYAPLQILATTTVMAMVGPICARNYAAPRYAMLLVCLADLPFVAGGVFSSEHWLLLLLLMTPPFLYGSHQTIARFQAMAVQMLRAKNESQKLARHDPLTGLLNRDGAMAALRAGTDETALRLTLFYMDLDGFKQVNDNFGHLAGDRLLQDVAARLRAGARSGDIVARMGGDEFVLMAPGMPPADAEAFASRLIRLIEAPYDLPGAGIAEVGVSVGFACAPDDSTTMAELYRLADAALYEAKAGGKGTQRRTGAPLLPSAA